MPADRTPPPPERVEGPTPAGGAYALAYRLRPGGPIVEIVEFDAAGRELARTYVGTGPWDLPG